MKSLLFTLTPLVAMLIPGYAVADNTDVCGFSGSARFVESAPRDRFRITNTSDNEWQINAIKLDLTTSRAI